MMKSFVKLLLVCFGVLASYGVFANNASDHVAIAAMQSELSIEQIQVIKKYIHDAKNLGHSDLQIAQEFEQAIAGMQEKNGVLELSLNYNPRVVKYVVVGLSVTAVISIVAGIYYYYFMRTNTAQQITNQPTPQNNVPATQPSVTAQSANSDAPATSVRNPVNQGAPTNSAAHSVPVQAGNPATTQPVAAPVVAQPVVNQHAEPAVGVPAPVVPDVPVANQVPNDAPVQAENPVVAQQVANPVVADIAVEPVAQGVPQANQQEEPVVAEPAPVVPDVPVPVVPEPVADHVPNDVPVIAENQGAPLEVNPVAPVIENTEPAVELAPVRSVRRSPVRRSPERDKNLAIPATTNFRVPPSCERRESDTRAGSGRRTGSGRVSRPVKHYGYND